MNKFTPAKHMTDAQAMKRLKLLADNLRDAQCDLEDFITELHDDGDRWDRITYAQLASVMGVSRQAVQQRVFRMLERSSARRGAGPKVHPEQLALGD